jgi:uncharacterized protein
MNVPKQTPTTKLPAPGRSPGRGWAHAANSMVSEAVTVRCIALATGLVAILLVAAVTAPARAESKVNVGFIGDSTADGLWGGVTRLVPRDSCLKGNVELGRFGKNSTGLTRPDRFNWADEVKKIAASFKPDLFVMSLGLNDRQSVVVDGKVTLETSSEYPARYKDRITAVLNNVAATGAHLLWIGLPAMRDAAPDRDAREKNKLFAEALRDFGNSKFHYVPPWRLSDRDEDKFASYGPDQSGRIIQIRASDGEHFTPAGELLVAAYLLPRIIAILIASGAKLGESCAS